MIKSGLLPKHRSENQVFFLAPPTKLETGTTNFVIIIVFYMPLGCLLLVPILPFWRRQERRRCLPDLTTSICSFLGGFFLMDDKSSEDKALPGSAALHHAEMRVGFAFISLLARRTITADPSQRRFICHVCLFLRGSFPFFFLYILRRLRFTAFVRRR